ncbi:MAG: hypothetical protein EHM64_02130 [Ignavibacteriae bacterium]|nr:MAG: hypothetical protein EHM64_02130 [Ignavibacteriota bacterium]
MKMYFVLCVTLAFLFCPAQELPPGAKLSHLKILNLISDTVEVPKKFKGKFPEGRLLNIPVQYTVKVFYTGRLSKPRFFSWGPDSVLYVANKRSGEIIALPDKDHDGVADKAIVAVSGFHSPHDLKFYNGALYVTEERRIIKCTDKNHDGIYETKEVFIDHIAQGARQPGGGHDTRTMVFDPDKKKMYLSIGSSCNVCREDHRSIIEEYNDDGTGRRTFATGIRNAVGMAMHNGRLWADNNGSDWQGDKIPPEWIDIVRDGGFYGHPLAYGNGIYFDFNAHKEYQELLPITEEDSARVRSMVPPVALIPAHSAPMAIEFTGSNPSLPLTLRNGALVVLRGSWNRTVPTGYKVIYMKFRNNTDTTIQYVADLITGFQPTPTSPAGSIWGRPVGIAVDLRGNIYLGSDDITQCILILSPVPPPPQVRPN